MKGEKMKAYKSLIILLVVFLLVMTSCSSTTENNASKEAKNVVTSDETIHISYLPEVNQEDVYMSTIKHSDFLFLFDDPHLNYNLCPYVFVGTVMEVGPSRNTLIEDELQRHVDVYTPLSVRVEKVYRGDLEESNQISVLLDGGVMKMGDYVKALDEQTMEKGKLSQLSKDEQNQMIVHYSMYENPTNFQESKTYLFFSYGIIYEDYYSVIQENVAAREIDLKTDLIKAGDDKQKEQSLEMFVKEHFYEDDEVQEYIRQQENR